MSLRKSNKKNKLAKYALITVLVILALLLVLKLRGYLFLQMYVKVGIGDCKKIPVFCKSPDRDIVAPAINPESLTDFVPYHFDKMSAKVPKGFLVVQETIKKPYYKKQGQKFRGGVIYLLYQPPRYFPSLFPQLRKVGVKDNYEFLRRTMNAQVEKIADLADAFFVIFKGIFIPDLGDQQRVAMAFYKSEGARGFINYNLSAQGHFFDCNIIDQKDNFFKVFIKDYDSKLTLDNALEIISTLEAK